MAKAPAKFLIVAVLAVLPFDAFGACAECSGLEGHVDPDEISETIRCMVGKYPRAGAEAVAIQSERGVIETGLAPAFGDGVVCRPIDSETWAIDYSDRRPVPALHKGIDIPAPRGTPIRAVADGVVVAKFLNDSNRKGIEIMLRHEPEDTGLPFWTYSQYTHLLELPALPIGARVRMGEEIGQTSNTGLMGRRVRRDAVHFAIFFSQHPEFANDGVVVTPRDGYFMDPNGFYRSGPPYDSAALVALPADQKQVPIPYMLEVGTFFPEATKRIWPYPCARVGRS